MRQTIEGTNPTTGEVPFLLPVPTSAQPAPKQDWISGGQFLYRQKDTTNMTTLEDPKGFERTDIDGNSYIEEARVYTDQEVAVILFKDELKPTSVKSVQRWARKGLIRGKRVGRGWRFYGREIRDFLMRPMK